MLPSLPYRCLLVLHSHRFSRLYGLTLLCGFILCLQANPAAKPNYQTPKPPTKPAALSIPAASEATAATADPASGLCESEASSPAKPPKPTAAATADSNEAPEEEAGQADVSEEDQLDDSATAGDGQLAEEEEEEVKSPAKAAPAPLKPPAAAGRKKKALSVPACETMVQGCVCMSVPCLHAGLSKGLDLDTI